MADPKNPFDFGTGSIDKDQWLKDIDNEQEGFVLQYANAANKHRTTLLRLAFQDLRNRIASGDMLSRTADGLYQFGSALISGDKHMQEAYQRALGFMGNLARRQINTPAPEPEKKSVGNIEERWIKSLNPSGNYNKTAYWKNQTDEERRNNLKTFLNNELTKVNNHEYNDYGGFTDETTLTNRLKSVLTALESQKANDWTLQQLGFTKNWLQQPEEEKEEEAPKTRLEQAQENYQAAMADLQAALIEQLTAALNSPSPVTKSVFLDDPNKFWNYMSYKRLEQNRINNLKYTDENGNVFLKAGVGFNYAPMGNGVTSYTKTTRNTAWNGQVANAARTQAANLYNSEYNKELDSYFKNLGISYESLKDKKFTNPLMTNLAKLFTYKASQDGNQYVAANTIRKYFTLLENGTYGLKGTNFSYDPTQGIIYQTSNIDNYKEGGVIKALQGYVFDDSEYVNTPKLNKPQTSSELSNSPFSNSENARIAATIADIASMGVAFVPGYGTATSAALGLGSTATNFGADLADGQGLWNATKNAGFGLAADVMGLIPGLGGVGKGAKIARNIMWAVPKMMQWVNTYQGLKNAGEIKKSITKLAAPSSMTVQDWLNVSQALQIMTGHGRSVATKVKKAGMPKTTTTTDPEYYVFTNKGKLKVSDETFKKLREVRGVKDRLALTEELMGKGVKLQQTRFAPWNTSTRFGAFKKVPGQTKIEVQNKHKRWFSDENLVEKAENLNPSVDIRGILNKVNPYRTYYNNRVPKSGPLPEYLQRPVDILPQNFGMTKNGMAAGGFDMNKPKRKPLTEELKATRRLKAAAKKQEQKAKELENLRRLQMYGMSEEIPLASSQTINTQRKLERANLNSRFANEVEMPGPQRETLGNKFYRRYGDAVRRHQIGGILKALRNGGIIKAQGGTRTPVLAHNSKLEGNSFEDWANLEFGTTANQEWEWKNNSKRNGTNLETSYGMYNNDDGNLDLNSARSALHNYHTYNGGKNIIGDVVSYYNDWITLNPGKNYQEFADHYNDEVDALRTLNNKKLTTLFNTSGWGDFNNRHHKLYRSYGLRSEGGEVRDDWNEKLASDFGESTLRRVTNSFATAEQYKDQRTGLLSDKDLKSRIYMDNVGHIFLADLDSDGVKDVKAGEVKDKLGEVQTSFFTKIKNPFDPTLLLNSAKLATSLFGNADIYKNLLAEMPQAPLRDEIDRKLAIVGDQRSIDEARNKIGDLRHILRIQQGSDQQANFATALEAERVGRDIMDNGLRNDALRQFDTAQKSWNLDNEDLLYNTQVADANRRAIADRARMMAQIRAAYRNGNWNAIKNFVDDNSFWALKKYLTEKDLADAAKRELLGDFDSYVTTELYNDPNFAGEWKSLQLKVINNKATPEDHQRIEAIKAARLKKLRQDYSKLYYNLYHDPMFGGGAQTMMAKKGGSLEKEKLKARSKDNDRYVSMIKDLRKTSYRRRRR